MKCNYTLVSILTILTTLFGLLAPSDLQSSSGQDTNMTKVNSGINFTKLLQDKYTKAQTNPDVAKLFGNESGTALFQSVMVRYESPNTILINGPLINEFDRKFNQDVWEAMDMLKNQYGFKLQNVVTSGVGSEGNPTSVYILLTK